MWKKYKTITTMKNAYMFHKCQCAPSDSSAINVSMTISSETTPFSQPCQASNMNFF